MGERKGTNKYYPPDFDPKKHFSLDRYHGTHALRERAKKLNQGILVIRFEMPYNIWCDGCGSHIGMGVRYNAEKSKVGNYYTTPIWQFRMKCHLCDQYFLIKTDPANHDYVIVSGARRKEQRWDPKDNEQIVTEDKSDIKKMATDAMYKLEHAAEDKAKVKKVIPGIAEITEVQQLKKEDYLLNKLARQKFREEKKQLKSVAATDAALLAKSSLDIELLPEHADDVRMAELMKYRTVQTYDEKQQEKRLEIQSRPIFGNTVDETVSSTPSSSSSTVSSPGVVNNKQKQIENTKKKLALSISKAKSVGLKTFGSSAGGSTSKSSLDLGIVRKQSLTNHNELVQLHSKCDKEDSESAQGCEKVVDQETVSDKSVDEVSPSQTEGASVRLGCLVANYDSSSSADSD